MKNLDRQQYNRISGVYMIRNRLDFRVYIGSSNNLYKRINQHKKELEKNIHPNSYLQNFVNKYGLDNIYVEILEIINTNLLITEKKYIDLYNSANRQNGFNLDPNPVYRNSVPCSQETKNKISLANLNVSDEIKRKRIANCLKMVEKRLQMVSEGYSWPIHNKGVPMSEEQKKKSSDNFKRLYKEGKLKSNQEIPVIQYSKDEVFIQSFKSAAEACRKLGIEQMNIGACCRGKRKTAGGFKWKFKTNEEE